MAVAWLCAATVACASGGAARVPGAAATTVVPAGAPEAAAQAPGRLRAPSLACDRNHLTSYSGRVTGYTRGPTSTWLRIATDEDTVEEVRVPHAGDSDAHAQFLLRREPFPPAGLAAIEQAPGKLRAGMRAVAWVCDDGVTPPVVDWQPAPDPPAAATR